MKNWIKNLFSNQEDTQIIGHCLSDYKNQIEVSGIYGEYEHLVETEYVKSPVVEMCRSMANEPELWDSTYINITGVVGYYTHELLYKGSKVCDVTDDYFSRSEQEVIKHFCRKVEQYHAEGRKKDKRKELSALFCK